MRGHEGRALVSAAVVTAAYVVVAKAVGFVKEVALARQFGTGAEFDAYAYLFRLYSIPGALTMSVMTLVLTPLLVRARISADHTATCFGRELLGLSFAAAFALGVGAYLMTPIMLGYGNADANLVKRVTILAPLLAPLIPAGVVLGVLSAWLMSTSSRAVSLLEAVPAAFILIFILAVNSIDVAWLSLVTATGLVAQTAVTWLMLAQYVPKTAPVFFSLKSEDWRTAARALIVVLVGQGFMSLTTVVDQFFAATMPVGTLSTLTYAERLLSIFTSIGALVIMRVSIPFFSARLLHSGKGWATRQETGLLAVAVLIGALFSVACFLAGSFITRLVFEGGAFTQASTRAVSQMLTYLSLQLPFYFGGLVLYAALAAHSKFKEMACVTFLCLGTKLAITGTLAQEHGALALAFGTVATYVAFFIGCTYILYRRNK